MKNLFFSIVLVMTSLVTNSQVITIQMTGFRKFEHPSNISLYESERQGKLEFVSLCTTSTTFIYDLTSKKVTMINPDSSVWEGDITEIIPNGNVFDIYVGESLIILSNDVITGDYVYISEWKNGEVVVGELCIGNQMTVDIQK